MNCKVFHDYIKIFSVVSIVILFLSGCSKDKAEISENMQGNTQEQGIPVTVTEVIPSGFSKELSYFAVLSAYKESSVYAKVADKILKINASVGDFVNEGQVIMEFPSNNPDLQYEQTKAALENSEVNYKRMKELLAAGEISKQMYDNTYTQYIVNKRNFEQMEQMIQSKSPISGLVISMPYRVGDVTKSDDILYTVAMTNKMIAKINVSDFEVNLIKKGMIAEISWNGNQYKGIVSLIGMKMLEETHSIPVEIEMNNPKNELRSGITVDVKIKISDDSNIMAIDRKYILEENDKKYIFIEDNGIAKKRLISTGKESGIMVEVKSGLNPGDRLISCCTTFLEDGAKVKIGTQGSN